MASASRAARLSSPTPRWPTWRSCSACLVDLNSPGITRSKPFDLVSVRSCTVGELEFDNAFVPDSAVLGGVGGGSGVFTTAMDWERTCLFALHVGAMERLLEDAIKHARTRKQFGAPVAKLQAVSHRLADMKVRLEAARLLVYRTAWRLDHARTVSLDASISKLFVSESLLETATDALRTFGGAGLSHDNPTQRAVRDALASVLYSGTSDVQRMIIARWLGM
jgi:alkylation response protein AidB-like acyl-CoA dehydrogenase